MCFHLKERETYRWPVRESLKSMLAMNWNIERTKEGEAMFQQRESEKERKLSETQVFTLIKLNVKVFLTQDSVENK